MASFGLVFLLLAGIVVMLFPLWGLVQPGQTWPLNIFPWIALGVLALCALYGIIITRSSPDLAGRIGSHIADR